MHICHFSHKFWKKSGNVLGEKSKILGFAWGGGEHILLILHIMIQHSNLIWQELVVIAPKKQFGLN